MWKSKQNKIRQLFPNREDERESSYLDVELGLETGGESPGVEFGGSTGGEVNAGGSQRLHFTLQVTVVEAFAEQVAGGLAHI